jgi:hypothetical protein
MARPARIRKTIPSALIGIAGVHHVVSELSRRGFVALPTIRNTVGYDIIASRPDGRKHANIQVKSSQKKVTFWLMPSINDIRTGSNDYYVLVRWLPQEKRFECFMLTGKEARNEARRHKTTSKRAGRRILPISFVWIGHRSRNADRRWKRRWENWSL